MGRKSGRDDTFWLREDSDPKRIHDAENARRNRAEITKALSHGQIKRRDLVKWGLFTAGGLMLPIGGLNPFVRPLHADHGGGGGGGGCVPIPTGLSASPTFGVSAFSQPMPRFDVLPRNAVSTLTPAPQAQS